MKCMCPKCQAKIEIEVSEVSETGTPAACPACNAKFNLYLESFGSRALHRSGSISCAPCGEELGPHLHCQHCGAHFPDFVVAQAGRKQARKASKKVKLSGSPFSLPQKSAAPIPTLDAAFRTVQEKPTKRTGVSNLSKPLQIALGVIVLVALVAGGALYYTKHKAERTYTRNFAMATYCIQAGIDRAQKISGKIGAEWKQRTEAGQQFQPKPTADDERGFNQVEMKLDQAMQKLNKPPEKFSGCNDKLTKLRGNYAKWRSLVSAPGNSPQTFNENIVKLENEYKLAAKEFKNGMPTDMMEELVSASQKLKTLRPLVQ